MQRTVLNLLKIDDDEAEENLVFIVSSAAWLPTACWASNRFDRMIMLMTASDSIRDVIAFPKTQTASCLLTNAPGKAAQDQLDELHIRFHGLEKET
ncbi:MAG: hypothetical protein CM15mP86_10390 [Gammaproteobacteria bacterium]|nr:MAG: hypothetical protein CM15mP86_10390 [Gammaproteobacteria bacterium]